MSPDGADDRPTQILIVEDDRFNIHLLDEVCRATGYETRVAMDGEAALAAVEESVPDLVLLDVMIPRLDGFEVLAALRADPRTRQLPVLLVSAMQQPEVRARAITAGADDFLSKPFRIPVLRDRIHSALAVRAFIRDRLTE